MSTFHSLFYPLYSWFLSGLAFAAVVQPACARDKDQPRHRLNVLFILADDLGHGDLGCYGNATIKTPHLDRLAKEGMRFTQFYVASPVCTPSRAAFLTGRHPQRFGIHHADLPETRPRFPLPLSAVTVNKLLKKAGYRTAHFGKWHLGEPPDTGLPRKHGFDYFFGSLGGRPSSSWNKYARYDDAQFIRNEEQPKTYPGYATDVLTDQVLTHLEDAAKDDKPFYVDLWYNAPHEPLSPKVKQAALYPDADKKQRVYFGTVSSLDDNVGRVLKKLDELGLTDNTLVLFSSDNGPEAHSFPWAAGSAGPLRGMKTQLWEGGIREPFLVRLPKVVRAGTVTDVAASALDFLPTVCALTGVASPPPWERDEGMDLSPVLTGRVSALERTLFWEFHGAQRSRPPSGTLAVREGDWKLHVDVSKGRSELYNLRKDPGEKDNVIEREADLAARLEKKARTWYDGLPPDKAPRQRQSIPATEAEANRLPPER
jgi:N-acetylgalactosamine-6-sulfatase